MEFCNFVSAFRVNFKVYNTFTVGGILRGTIHCTAAWLAWDSNLNKLIERVQGDSVLLDLGGQIFYRRENIVIEESEVLSILEKYLARIFKILLHIILSCIYCIYLYIL